MLTGQWDELAGDAAGRPRWALVQEVLGHHAVPLAFLQPLDCDRRQLVHVILQRTETSTVKQSSLSSKPGAGSASQDAGLHLERFSLFAVEHAVFGVSSVFQSQAVVPQQVDGQGPGPGAQADPWGARVPWWNKSASEHLKPSFVSGGAAVGHHSWTPPVLKAAHRTCCRPGPAQTSAPAGPPARAAVCSRAGQQRLPTSRCIRWTISGRSRGRPSTRSHRN